MFQKRFLTLLLTVVVSSVCGAAAFAQNAPVRGVVMLEKADKTKTPVADVVVEAFRTDIDRGKMPEAKTNKRGEFNFVAFPLGQKFVLAVSGPGIGPRIQTNIKGGMENIQFIVNEGDGRRLTEAEAREAAKASADAPVGGMTEAQKKEEAELVKKNAQITANNERVKSGDETARRANSEGRAALDAKNYPLALSKFDEGITAVPDFVGSTPILVAGKILALKNLGFDLYVQGAKSSEASIKLAKYGEAKKEYEAALGAFRQGMDVLKKADVATDPKDQQARKAVMTDLYVNIIEVHRLMAVGQVDTSKTADAEAIIKDYLATETDAVKKSKMLMTLGDIMRASGEFDKAVAAYKTVLETSPENTEVMASLGLSLVAQGTAVDPPNREQMQEGLNYMQKYADTVAILPTDSQTVQEFKKSVKDTVEYLKTEQKLKAQPTKSASPRKKG